MVNTTVLLWVVAGLLVLFVALVIAGILGYLLWRSSRKFLKSLSDFAEGAAAVKTIGKAIVGYSRVAGAMSMEIAKLTIAVDRFGSLVMKPETEMNKTGYVVGTDKQADAAFDYGALYQQGYTEEEAATMVENAVNE